jgi:hypothetical protein
MEVTGIVILNVLLVATVVAGIVGLLSWSIVSSMRRADASRTRSHRTNRRYCMPEVRPTGARARATTHAFPLVDLDLDLGHDLGTSGRAERRP